MKGYEILSIDDLDQLESSDGSMTLSPLRRRVGFRPFGVNVWVGRQAGDRVIEEHRERDGAEELYVVLRGSAQFKLGDDQFDAPAGTLVHAPPGTLRGAIALAEDTRVLAMGAKPGEAFAPSGWEDFYVAFAQLRAGDEAAARATAGEALEREPDAWQGAYNMACFEALAGDSEAAFEQLRTALVRNPKEVATYLATDSDLDSLRGDPRFRELTR
ncbi:MAG: adenylate cyclase [Gaiellaceae bacterium]|jgi:mannose-6-phosphate isomerase-like protein (cupin superfamily)|nr:adenylate cyclase [Gaiellaceae bacterium]